jgi:prophage tail gpP-like protein
MPKPAETAVLTVAGAQFQDWQSVWVQKSWGDGFTYFRFTAAERDPIFFGKNTFPLASKLQFKPGDKCTITLAGTQVVDGFIETRQVAYDGQQHGVMLIGKSMTAWAARSSVDSKTGNFDGKNIQQIAQEVVAPYGVGIKVIGALNLKPFKRLQNEPGEQVWDFIERIARFRGARLAADSFGNFLLIGQHSNPGSGQLVEGVNIKSCQCTITIKEAFRLYDGRSQQNGSDSVNGTAASEQHVELPGTVTAIPSKRTTPGETPDDDLHDRVNTDKIWHDNSIVQANIIVPGWLSDGQALWQEGKEYFVNSPMAMLQQTLKARSVTFTQDENGGTQTILDMVLPALLNGSPNFDPTPSGDAPQTKTQILIRPPPGGFPSQQ